MKLVLASLVCMSAVLAASIVSQPCGAEPAMTGPHRLTVVKAIKPPLIDGKLVQAIFYAFALWEPERLPGETAFTWSSTTGQWERAEGVLSFGVYEYKHFSGVENRPSIRSLRRTTRDWRNQRTRLPRVVPTRIGTYRGAELTFEIAS